MKHKILENEFCEKYFFKIKKFFKSLSALFRFGNLK